MPGHDYNPFKSQQSRIEHPSEPLFEFVRASDGARISCVLRNHGKWGVEAQFLERGELFFSRRFDTRALAVQWAQLERQDMEKGGER